MRTALRHTGWRNCWLGVVALASAAQVGGGGEPGTWERQGPPKAEEGAPKAQAPVDLAKLTLFKDKEAGYSMRLPEGYTRLTQDENREVANNLSEYFGKEASERALRQPPAYFRGPLDPARPKGMPPSLVVNCTGAPLAVDRAQKQQYKEMIEESYRKRGIRHGDIAVDVIQVGSVNAVRAEHDLFSPVDNSRNRVIMVLVPGPDRRYNITLNFSTYQAQAAEAALDVVLRTFKIHPPAAVDAETQIKWGRVALWTAGGFITGILLSLILKALSAAARKQAQGNG